jgi:Phage portal protein
MSWQDRLSDAIGRGLGTVGNLVADSFAKATTAMETNRAAERALVKEGMPEPASDPPPGLRWDPWAFADQVGFRDRPTALTYEMQKALAFRAPPIAVILQTRAKQLGTFGKPVERRRDPGFQVVMRSEKDKPKKADLKMIEALQGYVRNTGATYAYGKDSFGTFLEKFGRDSMTHDQGVFVVNDNRAGKPSDFYALDGTTFRIADMPLGADLDDDPKRTRFVQVYDSTVVEEFAAHELCFGVRNPRTDINLNGYGTAEAEMVVNSITALLYGFDYNRNFFRQGTVAKGIINFRGAIPAPQLNAFRRYWYQMVSGVQNAWRTPITNAEELQYINLHTNNRDMEFSAWLDWLIKVVCATYQFDPAEMNFIYGNQGQSSSMFQAPAEARIKSSKDRGLRPILTFIADCLNRYVIWRINENFKLVFTGIDPRDSQQIIDGEKKQVTYLKTVDEVRAENDLEPLPDGQGEVILDTVWLQHVQGKQAAAQGDDVDWGGDFNQDVEEGDDSEGDDSEDENDGQGGGGDGQEKNQGAVKKSARVTERRGRKTVSYDVEL